MENDNDFNKKRVVNSSKETMKSEAKGFYNSIKNFISELLDFREDTDREATVEAIVNDIPFKGATAWILICSVFVASVGLNANSTAVVIGAMLISPLMGPILGIGLSVATNDIDTLRKSLINFGVMIILSVLTAFLFFRFFPLQEESSELLARTQPDIRDVLIAFFGGLALIIARTKKGTIASVIFGVAIATALMPPLCTVGYGLAVAFTEDLNKGLNFAGGAMYLFLINTIFIAFATFLTLKILNFPMRRYANSKRRKFIARIATVLAVAVMIPAFYTFINVLNESKFRNNAKYFIDHELEALPNAQYLKKHASYTYNPTGKSTIEITTFGMDKIPAETVAVLERRFKDYSSLDNVELRVNQANAFDPIDNLEYMAELRSRDSLDIVSQRQKIDFLEKRVTQLSRLERNQIPFPELVQEVKINYEELETFSFANEIQANSSFSRIDTISVFKVKWKKSEAMDSTAQWQLNRKLERWLRVKLDLDSIVVQQSF